MKIAGARVCSRRGGGGWHGGEDVSDCRHRRRPGLPGERRKLGSNYDFRKTTELVQVTPSCTVESHWEELRARPPFLGRQGWGAVVGHEKIDKSIKYELGEEGKTLLALAVSPSVLSRHEENFTGLLLIRLRCLVSKFKTNSERT